MNKNSIVALAAVQGAMLAAGEKQLTKKDPKDYMPAKPGIITKHDVEVFLSQFIAVSYSYSGHDNTFYIRGAEAEHAELMVLKALPGMSFKTHSDSNPYSRKPDVKKYYFRKNGEFTHNAASNGIIFDCIARDNTNARRKFGNYISSPEYAAALAGTDNKYASNPVEVLDKITGKATV